MSRTGRPWALALLAVVLVFATAAALFRVRGLTEDTAHRRSPLAAHAPFSPQPAAGPGEEAPPVKPADATESDDDEDTRTLTGPEAQERAARQSANGLSDAEGDGALVMATPPGSSASVLALLPGDVITSANGQPIRSAADFARFFRDHGQPSTVTVLREGQELTLP